MPWIAIYAGILGWIVALILCVCLVRAGSWADKASEEDYHRLTHPDCELRKHPERKRPKHYA